MASSWKIAKIESFQNNDMAVITFEGWEKKFNEVLLLLIILFKNSFIVKFFFVLIQINKFY